MGHIFLSYSRKDIHMMQRLRDDLRAEGLDVWTDESLSTGSQSWKQDVEEAIENASALVVLLTPNAKKSTWVREEMNYAEAQDVRIFPVLASGTPRESVPFGFITAQWVDFRNATEYATELQKLIFTLRGHLVLEIAEEEGSDDETEPVTKVYTASDLDPPQQKTTLAPDAPTRQRRKASRVFPRNISKAIMVLQNRESKWWRRVDAINHLAALRNPITLPVLKAYLDDDDIDVQNAAAKAIATIQGEIIEDDESMLPEVDETAVRRNTPDEIDVDPSEMPITPTEENLHRLKLVVTGPTDDLRTRFIRAVSEIKPVTISRDIKAGESQRVGVNTTASMSMGRISVSDDLMVYLFGMPGQHHFDFMWKVLSEGMLGFVFVVDSTDPETFRDAKAILEKFRAQVQVPYVIAADNANKSNAWQPSDIRIAMRLGNYVKVVPCVSESPESVRKVLLELIYHISDEAEH